MRLRRLARGRHPDLKPWPAELLGTVKDVPGSGAEPPFLVPRFRLRAKTRLELDELILTEPRRMLAPLVGGLDDAEIDDRWVDEDDPGVATSGVLVGQSLH